MNWGAFLAEHLWQGPTLLLLLVGSGFFSGTETALFNLTRGQIHRLRHGGPTGHLIATLTARPQRLLNTLLLGNMLVNVAYAGISSVILLDLRRAGAAGWVVAAASLVAMLGLILLGEVAPKMLAYALHEQWARLAAWVVWLVERILVPIIWLLEALFVRPMTRILAPRPADGAGDISEQELGAVLSLSAKRGVLDHDANALLQEIIELSDLRVRDIMVPRVDMIAYDVDAGRDGLAELFRQTHLRKIPVYEGTPDNVLGVVPAKRLLLAPRTPLRDLVRPVPFLPDAARVERALLRFRVTRTQMAIVVDEYGGTAGLVTLEDILEQIVGDIPEPQDAPAGPAVQFVADNVYRIDGDLPIHAWVDTFRIDLSGRRISTLGGFVTAQLGRIPRAGDTVTYRNLRFHVESMRGRRVGAVRLELLQEATA